MATIEETLRKLGLAAARGVPQLATGFVDLAALPFTMTGVMKPEQAVGSTAYLTSKGLLPPPQEGLLSETTELVSSAMNPATATKAALAKGGLLVAPMLTVSKNVKPEISMQVDRANRFIFRENKNPDIILTTSPNEFDPKYMSAYLEVMDKPEKVGGKGTATRLYLEALDVAKKNKMGWKSDTITSDATKKMYERLTNMGIPFQQVDSQFILSPQQLSKINLQKLPKK